MPRDLTAFVLLHPTYLSDFGLATEPDRHPEAPYFGLTRDRVEQYLEARIDRADLEVANAWMYGDRRKDPWGPCHLWTGPVRDGAPIANLSTGKVDAHRVVWELERHALPPTLVARPRCSHNPLCVTERHLALFRMRETTGKLTRRERDDMVHMAVRDIEADPERREWPTYERYARVFSISPSTVRYHIKRSPTYLRLCDERAAADHAEDVARHTLPIGQPAPSA